MTKKVLVTLTLLLVVLGTSFAQYGRPRKKRTAEERAQWAVTRLTKPLTLTAEQQTTVKAAHLEMEELVDGLRAQRKAKTIEIADYKAKREVGRKAREEKINAVLDDAQKKKYQKVKKNIHAQMKERRAKQKAKKGDKKKVTDEDLDNEG